MKQFLIVLSLFFSNFLFSQTKIETKYIQIGYWETEIDDWKYGEWQEANFEFLIDSNRISINDEYESVYTTFDNPEILDDFFIWKAKDRDNEDCYFIINLEYIIITYMYNFSIAYER